MSPENKAHVARVLRRVAHEALALIFGFGLIGVVIFTVWTLQGKL